MSLAQAAFTEEGLSKLWNELVKDGEIGGSGGEPSNRKEEEEDGQARRSPFTVFLEEWTWGQVCVCGVGSEGEEESISLCRFNRFTSLVPRPIRGYTLKGLWALERGYLSQRKRI